MRDYACISPAFWIRGSGRKLRGYPEGQTLAQYLMSCPHGNMIGLFRLTIPTAAHDLGFTVDATRAALEKLCDPEIAIALYDEEAEIVFLPNAARYQIGPLLKPGDKRIKGVVRELQPYRDHRFSALFIEIYKDSYNLLQFVTVNDSGFQLRTSQQVASKGLTKALRSQDQDQDQDQEQKKGPSAAKRYHPTDTTRSALSAHAAEDADNNLSDDAERIRAALARYSRLNRLATGGYAQQLEVYAYERGKPIPLVLDALIDANAKARDEWTKEHLWHFVLGCVKFSKYRDKTRDAHPPQPRPLVDKDWDSLKKPSPKPKPEGYVERPVVVSELPHVSPEEAIASTFRTLTTVGLCKGARALSTEQVLASISGSGKTG